MNTLTSIKREINVNDMAGIVLSSIPAKTRTVIPNRIPLSPGGAKFMERIYRLRETVENISPTDLGQERVAENLKNIKNINTNFKSALLFL
jgi:hypothetical protein